MNHEVMFSSASSEWATPRWLVGLLEAEWGPFDLDPPATPESERPEPAWR
jgi:hypothetical protein